MTELQLIQEIGAGLVLGGLVITWLVGRPWIEGLVPAYTRKYNYRYEPTEFAPPHAMLRAWWGCRKARRYNGTLKPTTSIRRLHPMVFKGPTTADRDGDSTSSHCFCGEHSGQYIPQRDEQRTWFRYVETKRELDDIEAAQETRRQFERETIKRSGGGDWRWETVDVDPWNTERRRVYSFTDTMKADKCRCGHVRTLHENDGDLRNGDPIVQYRRCMGSRRVYKEIQPELRTNDGMDVLQKRITESSEVGCACLTFTEPRQSGTFSVADMGELERLVRPGDWTFEIVQGPKTGKNFSISGFLTDDDREAAARPVPENITERIRQGLAKRARREEGLV